MNTVDVVGQQSTSELLRWAIEERFSGRIDLAGDNRATIHCVNGFVTQIETGETDGAMDDLSKPEVHEVLARKLATVLVQSTGSHNVTPNSGPPAGARWLFGPESLISTAEELVGAGQSAPPERDTFTIVNVPEQPEPLPKPARATAPKPPPAPETNRPPAAPRTSPTREVTTTSRDSKRPAGAPVRLDYVQDERIVHLSGAAWNLVVAATAETAPTHLASKLHWDRSRVDSALQELVDLGLAGHATNPPPTREHSLERAIAASASGNGTGRSPNAPLPNASHPQTPMPRPASRTEEPAPAVAAGAEPATSATPVQGTRRRASALRRLIRGLS